jgi:hypothetical protein
MRFRSQTKSFCHVLCSIALAGCQAGTSTDPLHANRDVEARALPIQGGEIESDYPAVGMVVDRNGYSCTGTLISPALALTARHCSGNGLVFRTVNADSSFATHAVVRTILHPYARDLMLLQLETPITDITPISIGDAGLPSAGTACMAVGFGRHTQDGLTTSGTKRSAAVEVSSADDIAVVVQQSTGYPDHGDSGGPLLCAGEITGVFHGNEAFGSVYAKLDTAWIRSPYQGSPLQAATRVTQARNTDGHLQARRIEPGGTTVYESFQDMPNGSYVQFYNYRWDQPATALTLTPNGDSRLEAVYLGSDAAPYRYSQTAVNDSWGWNDPVAIEPGLNANTLAVAMNADGGLQAFYARATDAEVHTSVQESLDYWLYHNFRRPIEGELEWSDSAALTPLIHAKALAPVLQARGRMYLFYIGQDDGIYYVAQTDWAKREWTSPTRIAGTARARAIATASNANGALEVFYTGFDDLIYHSWERADLSFSSGALLSSLATSALAAGQNADGRLELFSIGTDGLMSHQWQLALNGQGSGTGWSQQHPLQSGTYGTSLNVAMNLDGRLTVLYLGTDAQTHETHQDSPNGAWTAPAALP